eukprot:3018009-Prymnesium_polylepis.1
MAIKRRWMQSPAAGRRRRATRTGTSSPFADGAVHRGLRRRRRRQAGRAPAGRLRVRINGKTAAGNRYGVVWEKGGA